jgi:hypothetical protein
MQGQIILNMDGAASQDSGNLNALGTVTAIQALQVPSLSAQQIASLSTTAFGNLSSGQIAALTPAEFFRQPPRTTLGFSLFVSAPSGEYDPTKLINISAHRWAFKPEIGLSRTNGHWIFEGMVGGWFFTDNTDFVGGRTRQQDPIGAVQAHLTYRFKRTIWLAGDANYFTGGQTTIGGKQNLDLQKNSRVGATFSAAIDRHQAIRAPVSKGAYTTIGADFWSIAVGYNYAWTR